MDIHKINRMVDLFMKRLYDVDVYLTEYKYGMKDEEYKINLLVFPSKFLKNSPEFSEKYYDFLNRDEKDILDDILKAFRYLGIDRKNINTDTIYYDISSKIPDYLKKYNEEFISNINEYISNSDLSEIISNVRINRLEPSIPHGSNYHVPYIDLRLYFDSNNKNVDASYYLNDNIFRKPLMDYISTKMEVDPQIDFWFE
jgi:hypothetical protein